MKLKVSELFYSAQGEGRFIGVPSVFLRTFGCNFTCAGFGCKPGEKSTEADEVAKTVHLYKTFEELPLVNTGCDSYASWHPDFKDLSPTYEIDALVSKMLDLIPDRKWTNRTGNDTHLVITGGEPLLGWQRTYQDLFDHDHMRSIKNVTFETNGTQKLQPKFKTYLNKWLAGQNELTFSVSPKLSASGEVWDEAIKPEIVAEYQEVELVDEAKAFWGQFEPQPSSSLPEVGMGAIFDHHGLTANFGKGLKPAERAADRKSAEEAYERIKTIAAKRKKVQDYVPDILGGIDAWQLYIPNLKEEHVVVKPSIPSNDMAALAVHFSFSPK